MKILLALGGNMISDSTNSSEIFSDQLNRINQSAKLIVDIFEMGHEIIISHGNGPQVGSLLLQQNTEINGTVKLPLSILGALTQGQIGVALQHSLLNEFSLRQIKQDVIVIPTSIIVNSNDEKFSNPTKPIGPYLDQSQYNKQIQKNKSWSYVQTPNGFRRVVASPKPLQILEINTIKSLLSNKALVICSGGGGTPISIDNNTISRKDAVIDKDLASSLLANEINADVLIILTNVDGIYQNFNGDHPSIISHMTSNEASKFLSTNSGGIGTMNPKINAAINFNGQFTLITSPQNVLKALNNESGTKISN